MAAAKVNGRLSERLRIAPGSKVDLGTFDPGQTFGWKREDAEAQQQQYEAALTDLQERLWAEGKRSLLIVLQGIDAAGKDGTIRHVMDAFNPQGCNVVGFKAPTAEELRHDFLWRIHPHTPGKGSVAIFNRSHYEDVIVVRVHDLVPRKVWRGRYRTINEWERMLVEEGTTILKFFLYIDRDEQRERLQARIDDPHKRWKFSSADLPERERWDRVHRGLRGGARAHLHGVGALVPHPCQSQMVPQPRGRPCRGRGHRAARPAVPAGRSGHREDRRQVGSGLRSNAIRPSVRPSTTSEGRSPILRAPIRS